MTTNPVTDGRVGTWSVVQLCVRPQLCAAPEMLAPTLGPSSVQTTARSLHLLAWTPAPPLEGGAGPG